MQLFADILRRESVSRPRIALAFLGVSSGHVPSLDYDRVATSYDRRYAEHDYAGIEAALREIAVGRSRALEVGCGTGHWLGLLRDGGEAFGIDPSRSMLRGASQLSSGSLARARAESLPFRDGAFDLVFAINALHHFDDGPRFFAEARRVLRPGGRLVTMGLDPSAERDSWFVYDYFDDTLELDRRRYPSTTAIADWLEAAGFRDVRTRCAQHIVDDRSAREYVESGAMSKGSTSQLALLSDEAFARGMERIWRDIRQAESRGDVLTLRGDLRIYASSAKAPLPGKARLVRREPS